ncbi:metalloregulator ArsR/SmtB family transcription factor [Verrucomicrobium sp. 3C]|uniref:helix-turn-helix transcriptional regulator n=1 Tax=Verrucomicrobium sp. 3C TaxID=1134055 RepID=UPI00039A56EF|nr:winged helix-turn-helix transcriptional regulator [Verrucomicrobium sp. 3C]
MEAIRKGICPFSHRLFKKRLTRPLDLCYNEAEPLSLSSVMDSDNSSPIRNQKQAILGEIKRSDGLSVGELAERMNLSYMGVKQHCNALEKEGYLSTQRRAKRVGRPEKLYILTEKANEFFPQKGTPFVLELLESIDDVYGSLAVDRILHRLYSRRIEALRSRISASALSERARQLARAREEEGYMSRYEPSGAPHGQVLEFHSPVLEILDRFPRAREFERALFERLLGTQVERSEDRTRGGFRVAFLLLDSEDREPVEEAGSFVASSEAPGREVAPPPPVITPIPSAARGTAVREKRCGKRNGQVLD